MKPHLVVMARAPRLGRVKQRLAADIGALAALRFYRQTTGRLLGRLSRDRRWSTWLALTPDLALRGGGAPWPFKGRLLAQGQGDLGQRMGRLLLGLPPGPVVIVGTDIPDIAPDHIAQAFSALGRNDWVLGPAADGGYWLIGARRRPAIRTPFAAVRWSSPHTLTDTLANLDARQVGFLETLEDIDHGADLIRWQKAQKSPVAPQATRTS